MSTRIQLRVEPLVVMSIQQRHREWAPRRIDLTWTRNRATASVVEPSGGEPDVLDLYSAMGVDVAFESVPVDRTRTLELTHLQSTAGQFRMEMTQRGLFTGWANQELPEPTRVRWICERAGTRHPDINGDTIALEYSEMTGQHVLHALNRPQRDQYRVGRFGPRMAQQGIEGVWMS